MKPNIQQNVVPRRSSVGSGFSTQKVYRRRHAIGRDSSLHAQRGSVDHATMTMTLGLMALLVVGLLGFFYLQQVLTTASEGTDIRALESQIVQLREQQRELELQGAELRSLQVVEDHVQKLNLVRPDTVTYLAPTQDRVARIAE
jgi:hypothetical protein